MQNKKPIGIIAAFIIIITSSSLCGLVLLFNERNQTAEPAAQAESSPTVKLEPQPATAETAEGRDGGTRLQIFDSGYSAAAPEAQPVEPDTSFQATALVIEAPATPEPQSVELDTPSQATAFAIEVPATPEPDPEPQSVELDTPSQEVEYVLLEENTICAGVIRDPMYMPGYSYKSWMLTCDWVRVDIAVKGNPTNKEVHALWEWMQANEWDARSFVLLVIYDYNGSDSREGYGTAHIDSRKSYMKAGISEYSPDCQYQEAVQRFETYNAPAIIITNKGEGYCLAGYLGPNPDQETIQEYRYTPTIFYTTILQSQD